MAHFRQGCLWWLHDLRRTSRPPHYHRRRPYHPHRPHHRPRCLRHPRRPRSHRLRRPVHHHRLPAPRRHHRSPRHPARHCSALATRAARAAFTATRAAARAAAAPSCAHAALGVVDLAHVKLTDASTCVTDGAGNYGNNERCTIQVGYAVRITAMSSPRRPTSTTLRSVTCATTARKGRTAS